MRLGGVPSTGLAHSSPTGVWRCLLAPRRQVQARGLFDSLFTSTVAVEAAPTEWWQKHSELWVDISDGAALRAFVSGSDRLVLVDWFSPDCRGCEKSFPELCRLTRDPELKRKFKFAKINVGRPECKELSRSEGIASLPSVTVYHPTDGRLVTIEAPASKLKHLKMNLMVVALNPGCEYRLDPNSFVVPLGKAQAVYRKEQPKQLGMAATAAAAAAATSFASMGSLSGAEENGQSGSEGEHGESECDGDSCGNIDW